ncbi:MAG: hypothetical protein GY765_27235, partial [bacterium]|nr:hypothetical protein [bacterium]
MIDAVFDLSSGLLTRELVEVLEYVAVCAAGPVPLEFLCRLSGDENIRERLERLWTLSWCDKTQKDGETFYSVHQLVRELVREKFGNRFKEDFIALLHGVFLSEKVHFTVKERFFPQMEEAVVYVVQDKDKALLLWLIS